MISSEDKLTKIFYIRVSTNAHYALNFGLEKPLEDLGIWERYEMHDILISMARDIEDMYPEVIGKSKTANPNHTIIDNKHNKVWREQNND